VIGRQRQLIAAARRRAVDDRDIKRWPEFALESSSPLRVSLVNLQKLTLWAWVAPRQPCGCWRPAQNTRFFGPTAAAPTLTPGCSKRRPLHPRPPSSMVDAEIVGIQLELITFE